jgi:hypothetical protein
MSVSNDGVSRFTASTVYAPQTFNSGISSSSVTAVGAKALTLSSADALYLGGALANQDLVTVAGVNTYLTPLPFMCSIYLANAATIVLPPLYSGARIVINNTSGADRACNAAGVQVIIDCLGGAVNNLFTLPSFSSTTFYNNDGSWMAVCTQP